MKDIFIADKLIPRITLNPWLALRGFQATRSVLGSFSIGTDVKMWREKEVSR